jgi:cell division septation protein DedD
MALKNRRLFELRLGKSGLILFIIGMSSLLFCGFLIGVVVGKHMEAYPEQYAFGLMGLVRDRLLSAAPEAVKKEGGDAEEETFNLTFYDTLGGAKKKGAAPGSRGGDTSSKAPDATAGQAAPPAKTQSKETPAAPPEAAAGQTAPPATAGEEGQKRQNTSVAGPAGAAGTGPPPSQPPAPQAKTAPPAAGRFEIQVAAYREERQAQRMVKRFAALGFSPHVVVKDFPEQGRWYRVIVAGFESREEANEASERIVAKFRGIKCVIRPAGKS